jgi:hypothetical protein
MRRRLRTTVAIVLLFAGVCFIARLVRQHSRYERAYEGLRRGTDKSEVLEHFGRPSLIESCNLSPSWDAMPAANVECVEQFRYVSWVSPEQWIVGFDRHSRAVTKYYFSSP